MSARIFPRLILLPALLWVLLASTLVHVLFAADPPRPFTLLRTVGPSVFLDYYPTNTSGVSILHFSDQLPQLRASNADLFEVAADSAPITFDITSFVGGNRGFFAVTEFPGRTAADYATDEPEATEPTPAYLVQTLTAISYPLTANQPVTVSFQLLDATTSDPATVNGTVAFRLVDAAGDPVAFAYTLVPASLAVVNGAVNGTITVQTTAALSNVFLAIGSVSASGGLGAWAASKANALAASGGGVVGYPVQALSAYQQPTGSWRHPFHGANYALSGNYGEWREKAGNTAGRAHEGLDFAAPLNADVYPIAGGVVARVAEVGGGLGKLVVINHGNGYASRYLHITPSVQENQIVTTNTVLGKIAPIAKRHLHLEMRQNCAVYYRKNQPGKPAGDAYEVGASPGPGTHYNPLRDNDLFDAPLVVDGVNDSTAPRIRALNLFAATEDPRAGYIPASATGVRSPLNAALLVAEVVDGDGTYTLAPWRVKLVTEEPASGALTNVVVDQKFASAAASVICSSHWARRSSATLAVSGARWPNRTASPFGSRWIRPATRPTRMARGRCNSSSQTASAITPRVGFGNLARKSPTPVRRRWTRRLRPVRFSR